MSHSISEWIGMGLIVNILTMSMVGIAWSWFAAPPRPAVKRSVRIALFVGMLIPFLTPISFSVTGMYITLKEVAAFFAGAEAGD